MKFQTIKAVLASIFLGGASLVQAQTTNIDYGSYFEAVEPFPALYFADENGIRFGEGGTNDGILAVGYFGNIGANVSFSDYLADFNMIGNTNFVGPADSPGFVVAQATTSTDLTAEDPFYLLLGGIDSFANASSATSFAVINDTGWAFQAPNVPPSTTNLITTLAPDNIVIGAIASVSDGNEITTVAVPEPSHFAIVSGLLGLGFVMWRKRRG